MLIKTLHIPPQLLVGPPQFCPLPPLAPRPPLRPLEADATSLLTAFLTSNLIPETSWLLITKN